MLNLCDRMFNVLKDKQKVIKGIGKGAVANVVYICPRKGHMPPLNFCFFLKKLHLTVLRIELRPSLMPPELLRDISQQG